MSPGASDRPRSFRCAAAARERDDPQLGTAPYTRRWLLVEHPGPWPVDALAAPDISPEIRSLLSRTAAAHTARPLLIRRPGRTPEPALRAWAVVDENAQVTWGSWGSDDDLRDAAANLAAPPPPAPSDGPPDVPPILLVCAHGLHDVCCALRGRPVAAALATVWPEATWECSHVGGDRFAANVVVLPDGVYYGNLNAHSAVASVRQHLAGEVAVDHLRGMTRVTPPAQVAIAAVHRRWGPMAARDVQVLNVEQKAGGVWQVELATPRIGVTSAVVRVAPYRRAAAQLTCRAVRETPATDYGVVEFLS